MVTPLFRLRGIVDSEFGPEESVRSDHSRLKELDITPGRPLNDNLQITTTSLSYS